MNITVIGTGNSGLAMAAHMSSEGNKVTLWNRTDANIEKLKETKVIKCEGLIKGDVKIDFVTSNIKEALIHPDIILITTPADSHKDLAKDIAINLKKKVLITLNPGRTFGAYEFLDVYRENKGIEGITIAETQTIIYTCRKTGIDSVNIIAMKSDILISTFNSEENSKIIDNLPTCIRKYFKPAKSIIETSIGNVGMILHCAPLLLNIGWTESKNSLYKYYYDGISPSIGNLLEKIDEERMQVSKRLGLEVESTKEWLIRTYNVKGDNIYECIQNNEAYKTINAPRCLKHRYILEDVPCGLVPLESIGKKYGMSMKYTGMIIDLASSVLDIDFREKGRNLSRYKNIEMETYEMIKLRNKE